MEAEFSGPVEHGVIGGIAAVSGELARHFPPSGAASQRTAGCAGGDVGELDAHTASLRTQRSNPDWHRGETLDCFAAARNDDAGGAAPSIIQLVEIPHRLHDRLEIRARVERVEQLRGVLEPTV